jgi:hypothetical protein
MLGSCGVFRDLGTRGQSHSPFHGFVRVIADRMKRLKLSAIEVAPGESRRKAVRW